MKTLAQHIIITTGIILCIGCKDPQQQVPAKQETATLPQQEQQQNKQVVEQEEAVSKEFENLKLTKKDPLPAKALVEFLPQKLGESGYPASVMKSERDGYMVTLARRQFSVPPKGSIIVSITDYGGSAVLNTKGYEMPHSEIGIRIEKILLPDGVGFKTFNPNNNSGIVAALVGGRFGIDIEAVSMPESFGDFGQILDKVNIEGLLKKAK